MKTLSDGGQQGYGVGKLRQEESQPRELKRICEPSLPQTNASKASQPPSDASQDATSGFAEARGSASPAKADDSHGPWVAGGEDDYEEESSCHYCGGEGWMLGDELDDPMWYDPGTAYKCPCCNGSGNAKDCTFW